MWIVLPNLTPWRGDRRRNIQPYYIGQGLGWPEYNQACSCKAALNQLGINCYVTAVGKA